MSKITAIPWWVTDIARAVKRPAPLISHAFPTRLRGRTEWAGRFREIAWTSGKRSGPFSRFVYFYAKPRRISLPLCSPGTRVHSFITAAVSFPSHLFISPLFLPLFLYFSLFVHRYTRCLSRFFSARKISPGFTRNERWASIFAATRIGFVR